SCIRTLKPGFRSDCGKIGQFFLIHSRSSDQERKSLLPSDELVSVPGFSGFCPSDSPRYFSGSFILYEYAFFVVPKQEKIGCLFLERAVVKKTMLSPSFSNVYSL